MLRVVYKKGLIIISHTTYFSGPQFGGAIGLILFLADSASVSMELLGFCESLLDCLKQYGNIDGITAVRSSDILIIGIPVLLVILVINIGGLDWVTRVEKVLLILLFVSQINFIVGTLKTPSSESRSKGFIGYNATLMESNLWQHYTINEESHKKHNFFSVFAIFFPAVTGVTAGASLSGDLKDPSYAIPIGTLLAIGITGLCYMSYAVLFAGCSLRYASGIIEEVYFADGTMNDTLKEQLNITRAFDDCDGRDCQYGLINNQQMMEIVSAWGPLMYLGCIVATLSSAFSSFEGAPRVLQALAKDKLLPGLTFFANGIGPNNDPVRGYFLVVIIAIIGLLVGDLNTVS